MVTRDAILALAERELDAKVAEAFGWQWWTDDEVSLLHSPDDSEELRDAIESGLMPKWRAGKEGTLNLRNVPYWSSAWEGVGLVVAEMAVKGYRFWLSPYVRDGYTAIFSRLFFLPDGIVTEPLSTAENHSQIPLAVARAALLALQEEE